ncbi:RidA family protein [Paracoccus alkanivorans]|uniref:RidA family protein n=1 Tax=Paracoccus alkanivorans TaxID=2116655 RepID=A0A3M0MAQ8_9RHOB|nr:RidA family protein [Paracoccus alkanivorans]RMC34395.1 RidA family protein [Paracoccus alkanivorans]
MSKAIINPETLFDPEPFGFSHVVSAPSGRLVYIAGQGGENRNGVLASGFEAQVGQAFSNLATAMSAAGVDPSHVVKISTFIVDHDETKLGLLTDAVRDLFGPSLPAQTLVPVTRLALDGMLFEVEAIAVVG